MPTKSCLLNPIPTFLLKECLGVLLPSITRHVNSSLIEGLFPDSFKQAVVIPLHSKKSSLPSDDLKNHSPVSALCFISKLVKWVVATQILDHIRCNHLGNRYQSTYKAGHSTDSALLFIKMKSTWHLQRGCLLSLCCLICQQCLGGSPSTWPTQSRQ